MQEARLISSWFIYNLNKCCVKKKHKSDQEGFADRQDTSFLNIGIRKDTFLRGTDLTPKMHACPVKYNMQETLKNQKWTKF